jgi:SpoVK/Ycf46/Vps4 family AAA+-type ATPase
MDHFNIVLGLCRSALKEPNTVVSGHVQRLVKALKKEGHDDEALALEDVLKKDNVSNSLQPSRVVVSKATISGENLTPSVKAPVDKETSTPLASILQPGELVTEDVPIFDMELSESLSSMLDEWKFADALRVEGIAPVLTMMLYGLPGTGKTMLGHYIARTLQLPLVTAKLDGLISSYLGTTARNISSLFSFANRYRCVLLLDEFDAVAKLRDDPHELGEIKRVVNTLLQCIDERARKGFTVAITNHQALLDPAVWRRFDIRIEIPLPNTESRIRIIDRLFDQEEDVKVKFLAWLSDGYGGSDIEKLCVFIKRQKIIKSENYDFMKTVKQYLQLSADNNDLRNRRLAAGPIEFLVSELSQVKELDFSQSKLSTLFDTTQPTISRWLKKS